MPRWRWILTLLSRQLWIRATLVGLLGVAAAILAAVAENYIPWKLQWDIGQDAIDSILTIIASSMLAVTTFSLNVMTSAYGSATNNVTPRATKLLMEDRIAQNVLSTFVGSFLFSIVGLVVLRTGAYGERGRAVLFVVTIGVLALIVVSLLRWIDHLNRLGRVGETTNRVEQATREAITARLETPALGAPPCSTRRTRRSAFRRRDRRRRDRLRRASRRSRSRQIRGSVWRRHFRRSPAGRLCLFGHHSRLDRWRQG